ncbi:MAG: relaxase/mobilization nuclease domain-containing protein [Clostridiales bacterium]|nr:relaxase/mobilization nuclease domain-containing protein [Clostridiales bacterium]
MHRKDGPVWFYHYVQSFSPEEEITGTLAHQTVREFAAQAWPDSEVLITAHLDAEHIHSHFLVNAVCWESGRMLRQGPSTLKNLRGISDELCMKYGLSVLTKQQPKKSRGMSSREYRSTTKGQSWKFRLMNTIDQCMRYASTKDDFLSLMESKGYQVRRPDGRKNITYTTPTGMKCRDDRLHDTKYTKEVMEDEFRIRAEIVSGVIEGAEPAADFWTTGTALSGRNGKSAGRGQRPVPAGARESGNLEAAGGAQSGPHSRSGAFVRAGGGHLHLGTDGGSGAGCSPGPGDATTGWEEERALYLAARFGYGAVRTGLADPAPAGDAGGHGGLADHLVRLGRSLERGQGADPVMDSSTMHHRSDRKTLRREQEKEIALGHKEDDHEEEQTWQRSQG